MARQKIKPVRYQVTPTVTAGAYAANDIVGGRLQFRGVGSGRLLAAMVTDAAAQNVNYFLILLASVPTDIADNATFDIADADLKNILTILSMPTTDRTAFASNSVTLTSALTAGNGGKGIPLVSEEGDGDIWGFLYTTGTPTYAATSDVTVVLVMGPDNPLD